MPLLHDGDSVRIGVDYYHYYPMQRRDIVIIEFNTDNDVRIKRLVGLPGDKVWLSEEGDLKVNDIVVLTHLTQQPRAFEAFAFFHSPPFALQKIIPEGKVLVLSDNYLGIDSRAWGFIDANALVGKVFAIDPLPGHSPPLRP